MTKEIPKDAPGKMGIPNLVDLELCTKMSEIEFLAYLVVLADVSRSFFLDILLHDVFFGDDLVANIFSGVFPRQVVPTKLHLPLQSPFPLEKSQAPSLAPLWDHIRAKLQFVHCGILFTGCKHVLESIKRRGPIMEKLFI